MLRSISLFAFSVCCVCTMGCGNATIPTTTVASTEQLVATQPATIHRVGIRVNSMSCVEGCFKGIQAVLEKREGIDKVELAPQKDPELIDNSVIYVNYRGELDSSEIERTILGAGFESIEFLENNDSH